MQWFLDLKVGSKLVSGFVFVAFIAAAIGAIGVVNIKAIDAADTEMYEKMAVPLADLGKISTYFKRVRVNTRVSHMRITSTS